MKKIHKHDALLGIFFAVVTVGIFAYLFSHLLTNSRAAGLPQQLEEKITKCYENHKVEGCPSADEIKNATDKKDKGCKMCYMRCNICVIQERVTGNKCAVDCGPTTPEDAAGELLPTLVPTLVP